MMLSILRYQWFWLLSLDPPSISLLCSPFVRRMPHSQCDLLASDSDTTPKCTKCISDAWVSTSFPLKIRRALQHGLGHVGRRIKCHVRAQRQIDDAIHEVLEDKDVKKKELKNCKPCKLNSPCPDYMCRRGRSKLHIWNVFDHTIIRDISCKYSWKCMIFQISILYGARYRI